MSSAAVSLLLGPSFAWDSLSILGGVKEAIEISTDNQSWKILQS